MNEYELLYVISPRLSADEVDATVERVGALIEGSGGSISMVDNWGRRRLAYPIRQHFEGAYVLTHCTLDGARVAEIERALQLNENVLRHLLVRGIIPGYDGPPEQDVVETRRPAFRPAAEEPVPADAEASADGEPAPDGVAVEATAEPAAEPDAVAAEANAPADGEPAPDGGAAEAVAEPPAEPDEAADAEAPADEAPAPDDGAAEVTAEPAAEPDEAADAEAPADEAPAPDDGAAEPPATPDADAVVAEAESSAAVDEAPRASEADDVASPAPAATE